jgi:hypothetical protein
VYVQYVCEFSPEEVRRNQNVGLYTAFSCSVIGVLFMIFIRYLKFKAKFDFMEWDADCCTSCDFTVNITITERLWDNFIK